MLIVLLSSDEISQEKWAKAIQGCHKPVLARWRHLVLSAVLGALHVTSRGGHKQIVDSLAAEPDTD